MAVRRNSFFMVVRIIGLFIIGMGVAFFVALSHVDLETLRGNVLQILRDSTGVPVEIDGAVSWKFSLRPRIQLDKVRVPNADWAKEKYAFESDQIVVRLNLLSLFRDRPTIQHVRVNNATFHIEQNAQGEYSIKRLSDSVENETSTKIDSEIDEDSIPEKIFVQPEYPFEDFGFGGVYIRNLVADIDGEVYQVSELSVRYMPKENEREYAGWVKSDSDVFPFIVSYSKYNADRKIYPMKIALATGGDALIANIALEGTSLMPIDFKIKGDVPDMASFGKLFNIDLSDVPALKLNIAGGVDRNKVTLRKSSITVRGTNLNLSGTYDWTKKIPAVNLDIESKSINLMQLFPELFPKHAWIRPNRDLNVFKDIPLYGTYLYGRNVKLHLNVDKLQVYRDLVLRELVLNFKAKDAYVQADASVMFAGGKVRALVDADINSDGELFTQIGLAGRSVSVGTLLQQLRIDGLVSDLPMNIDFYGRANGKNMSEIMRTITGPVQMYSAGDGYAHSELVAYMYGADFLTNLRHSIQDLFRSDKKYNQMKISCVTVNAKLRDGLAETQHGVAVETNAINLRLAGDVNLGKETMHLALTTVPVRGLKLSLTGNVVNSIEITGNLAEPDIQISGVAVAGKVASATGIGLLLAPFTGGIGLVAGAGVGLLAGDLLENWLADDSPCKTALKRGAPPRRGDPDWLDMPVTDLVEDLFNNKR